MRDLIGINRDNFYLLGATRSSNSYIKHALSGNCIDSK